MSDLIQITAEELADKLREASRKGAREERAKSAKSAKPTVKAGKAAQSAKPTVINMPRGYLRHPSPDASRPFFPGWDNVGRDSWTPVKGGPFKTAEEARAACLKDFASRSAYWLAGKAGKAAQSAKPTVKAAQSAKPTVKAAQSAKPTVKAGKAAQSAKPTDMTPDANATPSATPDANAS